MLEIKIAQKHHAEAIQDLFNHPEIIGWLGGFTMLETVKGKLAAKGQANYWLAYWDGELVGAMECGGRPQLHMMKYGQVGVLPEFRRRRISTSLYFAVTLQGMMEGRRLFEDSIVGDNQAQQLALPTMGLEKVAHLHHRTGSGKDLLLYAFDLMRAGWLTMLRRIPEVYKFEVLSNYYTDEVWKKNMELRVKEIDKLKNEKAPWATPLRQEFLSLNLLLQDFTNDFDRLGVRIVRDDTNPTDERRKAFDAKRKAEGVPGFFDQEKT